MSNVIEVSGLKKSYASRRGPINAVDGLDLSVSSGVVHGFLGANGSGKTTAIRSLVGQIREYSGDIRILGEQMPHGLPKVIDRFGALVEAPSFFPNFSGRRNLELLAKSRGFSKASVVSALETVGLTDRADHRFGTYSLGMKQRLGVAAVLLKDPELLILDEPANGLDPPGIIAMRTLFRRLASEGRTVFVSSHMLAEVELSCDRVTMVAKGRMVQSGSLDELRSLGESSIEVSVPGGIQEHESAAEVLRQAGFGVVHEIEGLKVATTSDRAHELTKLLADRDIYVSVLRPVIQNLEELFIGLTSEEAVSQ